jgi:hypothetical protein
MLHAPRLERFRDRALRLSKVAPKNMKRSRARAVRKLFFSQEAASSVT